MAQGTRVRWIRAAVAGLGVMVSTTLVGCTSWDKPKETKSTVQPKIGLPNTTTLPPGGGGAAQVGRQPVAPYNGPGGNIQPTGAFATGGPRPNTNTPNTVGGGQYPYGITPTGGTGSINPSISPSVQPAGGFGGPVSAAPIQQIGGTTAGYGTPPAPDLLGTPLPPPPPNAGNEFPGGIVTPPAPGPLAPPAPTSPPPSAGPLYPIKNF